MPSKGDEVNDILLKAAMTCSTCGGPKPCKHEQQKGETMPKDEGSCPDCDEAARLAYSDATTPGFFSPRCDKHRQPTAPSSPPPEPTLLETVQRIRKIVAETPGVIEALQELLDEHRGAPSDAGQPSETSMASERTIALRHAYERGKKDGTAALEKLRELEAKWRKQDDTNGGICPNEEASCCHAWCADELHEIIAPAPRLAEKD